MTYITKDRDILAHLSIDAGDERKLTVRRVKGVLKGWEGTGMELTERDRILSGDTVMVVLDDSMLRVTVTKSLL